MTFLKNSIKKVLFVQEMISNKSRGKMLYSYISHFIICVLHINSEHLKNKWKLLHSTF